MLDGTGNRYDLLIARNHRLIAQALEAREMAAKLRALQVEVIEQSLKLLPLIRENRRILWERRRAAEMVVGLPTQWEHSRHRCQAFLAPWPKPCPR
jgi:hypothetical protein